MDKVADKYEIIVIDDGSTDNSRVELSKLSREIKNLRLIFHRYNKGYGGAIKSGFKAARFDLIFYTDGDGQYDIGELKLLLPLMTDDIDVVNGIKMFRNDPWYRTLIGNLYNFAVRNLFNIDIFDTDCDFRLIRKKFISNLELEGNSGAICVELVKKLQLEGARFREVSVHHYDRLHGSSQFFKPMNILKTGIELIKLWFQLNVSTH